MPLKGTFPYYSDGVVGESYGKGNYKATNGRLYKVTDDGTAGTPLAWYPAPGFRGANSGGLNGVGHEGTVWCSATGGTGGAILLFDIPRLTPGHTVARSHGFQLRCLSE
ncbi:hypothetical protein [uncultured Rikenella sp.]|uniref:hypothetical protein n=1 Tax=uncultured Rikenella sp. TaxID=368003 RepID=UPI00260A5997|nr:hypothetical protein [uncultured Rikenella sp.]